MRASRLKTALGALRAAASEVESLIEEFEAERDPLASHIFTSRRNYRNRSDTKSGKRRDTSALVSYQEALRLGFGGSLDDWVRLLGAVPKR